MSAYFLAVVKHGLQSTAGSCARYPTQTEGEGAPELFNRRSVTTWHTTDAPAPLLSVLFSFWNNFVSAHLAVGHGFVDDITHTTVASNCPALHIPRNRVDPTRGARPFPRSSHAFNYRKVCGAHHSDRPRVRDMHVHFKVTGTCSPN